MRDLAALLAILATWTGVALTAIAWPEPGAITAAAVVAAIPITLAFTPHNTPKGGARR